jgi:hypothetical protein
VNNDDIVTKSAFGNVAAAYSIFKFQNFFGIAIEYAKQSKQNKLAHTKLNHSLPTINAIIKNTNNRTGKTIRGGSNN